MPHFLALSWPLRHDYARGGFKMLSNVRPERVPIQTMYHSLALAAFPFTAVWTGLATPLFLVDSAVLNAFFLYVSYRFLLEWSDDAAWRVFRHSIWYILVISGLLVIHHPDSAPATDDSPAEVSTS
jgi:heme O synthase-like polyprenyltransferase